MKTRFFSTPQKGKSSRAAIIRHCLLGASVLLCGSQAIAADKETAKDKDKDEGPTPEQVFEGGTNTFNNWVEFSGGGMITRGNRAQASQGLHLRGGGFGGIEDFHFQETVATNTTLTIDGRAIVDENDYKFKLGLKREDIGFLNFSYDNFRTWYNGTGGFYPPTGYQYAPRPGDLFIDRGEFAFEGGLTLKDIPKVTFKYTRRYRDGGKNSTMLGMGPVSSDPNNPLQRALIPSYYDIDEKIDTFKLDVAHRIKETDIGLGFRYEHGNLNNAFNSTSGPVLALQRTSDRQGTTYDMTSVHAFTETWLKKNLFFSTGFLFANLDETYTGSRSYSSDVDVNYISPLLGYTDLTGAAHKQEYVLNLSLMALPFKDFTIVPSIRVQKEDWNADSTAMETRGISSGAFASRSDRDLIDVRERLDLRYSGITNWVFYGGSEFTQGDGNLKENGGTIKLSNGDTLPIQRETDDSRFFQKYFAGVRWYPARRLTIDVGGYYKINKYDYNNEQDSTGNDPASANRYPGYLTMQGFDTYDGNMRITIRPVKNVSLVSRYEYQISTVQTRPDSASGLAQVDSSEMRSHIFGQNASWTPWTRLSLQAGFNYVVSDTKTPGADVTQAILNAQNNYWTVNFNSSVVLDNKTDLNLGYFYYRADNYELNSTVDMSLGAGAKEHGVTALLTRRLSPHVRMNLKYGFYHYEDVAFGGNNDYEAHVIYSSLQYRF